ncbi:ubiquinol-cytochrome C chaperone-domain-containing protein [Phakopsora pachyrhizi]|uniref:Ubiquinol-cytochrome C chaperone-domain-containing protein n=1 Tax=Phakopsora pachyrhizi TaxID=170000 RepID=A0AAV0ANG3_PHAPC|nr:ubiquinol-cytochrome C chaperone-domain-containing protein [Phakopsora pachyrhizi]
MSGLVKSRVNLKSSIHQFRFRLIKDSSNQSNLEKLLILQYNSKFSNRSHVTSYSTLTDSRTDRIRELTKFQNYYQQRRYFLTSRSAEENYVVGRSGKVYSHRTVKIVGTIGKLLGYNLTKSNAITVTSDYYDQCSQRFDKTKDFWIRDCGLPDSFQTWFQVTQLHLWLMTVRFRSMEAPLGKIYNQELVNHAFIDIESRIRSPPNKVTKSTLVKRYMKILLHQHLGSQASMDWSISQNDGSSDQLLADSVWRNIFGAEWGNGMGGVTGIFDNRGSSSPNHMGKGSNSGYRFETDVKFIEILERLVIYIRRELIRLDQIPDRSITRSNQSSSSDSTQTTDSITNFGQI